MYIELFRIFTYISFGMQNKVRGSINTKYLNAKFFLCLKHLPNYITLLCLPLLIGNNVPKLLTLFSNGISRFDLKMLHLQVTSVNLLLHISPQKSNRMLKFLEYFTFSYLFLLSIKLNSPAWIISFLSEVTGVFTKFLLECFLFYQVN